MHIPMYSSRKFLNEKEYFTLLNTSLLLCLAFAGCIIAQKHLPNIWQNPLNSDVSLGAVTIQHNNYIYIFISIYPFVPAVC